MNDIAIYEEILRLTKANAPFALATVVESKGSAPRKTGAKMIVRADKSILGTIGGGEVELEVIEAAHRAVATGKPELVSVTLTEKYGHVCGGKLSVYVEPFSIMPQLIIFGAGHVGQALAKTARFVGYRVTICDERAEYADSEKFEADEVVIGKGEQILPTLPINEDTCIVIATPRHEGDFAIARAAVKTPAQYIGMIGSRKKREVLMATLAAEGISQDDLDRLMIPVGLAIGAEGPQEIAVSIVSQLIQIRNSRANKCLSHSAGCRPVVADGVAETASAR
ncbi:MAG: XdhC/CoxI family protein [Smithellaceae bacterium]|nr:XdhC/CoxI family protein [Smithellaceae bacterium]